MLIFFLFADGGLRHEARRQVLRPDTQYVVFLAKDNAFAAVLPLYRAECARLGCDPEQVAAVDRMVARLQKWREEHPDRLKRPDAVGEELLG